MPSTILTTVVCTDCRHENEPERVYCHSCGARLNRTAVKVQQDNVEDTRKHVKKLFDPGRILMRALFFKFAKIVLGACIVAVLVTPIIPPELPEPTKAVALASQIRFDLEGAALRHRPPELSFTPDQVNAFLVSTLKTKPKALDLPLLDFKRVIFQTREGACSVTMERSLFGYSLFTTVSMTPTINAGKLEITNHGGHIGRMPVHPLLANYMGFLFADLRGLLDREIKLISKMGAIDLHDNAVVLTAPQ
jgi:hypothetical protein